jgi:hypothetical protein
VAHAEEERLARDGEAGLHAGDAAVVGDGVAPEARQRVEAFGRCERHFD